MVVALSRAIIEAILAADANYPLGDAPLAAARKPGPGDNIRPAADA